MEGIACATSALDWSTRRTLLAKLAALSGGLVDLIYQESRGVPLSALAATIDGQKPELAAFGGEQSCAFVQINSVFFFEDGESNAAVSVLIAPPAYLNLIFRLAAIPAGRDMVNDTWRSVSAADLAAMIPEAILQPSFVFAAFSFRLILPALRLLCGLALSYNVRLEIIARIRSATPCGAPQSRTAKHPAPPSSDLQNASVGGASKNCSLHFGQRIRSLLHNVQPARIAISISPGNPISLYACQGKKSSAVQC